LERAARRAAALHPERLVPLRVPAAALAGLALGVLALAALWLAPPLPAGNAVPEAERLQALRQMAAAMPQSEAAQQLEQALRTLERPDATPEERRRAIVQAQDAVD